jgi:hypothetical protein
MDTYEYNEMVQPRQGLEAQQHFWTVASNVSHIKNQLDSEFQQNKSPAFGYLESLSKVNPRQLGFDFRNG